jgi:nicotinate-nucleotide pyrophosphorylase (carboxylating)
LIHPEVLEAVGRALAEDIGSGDITTESCVPPERQAIGRFIAKQDLTLAGVDVLRVIYGEPELHKLDGDRLAAGEAIATVRGDARTLLTCERTALNFLQRLSGVATRARSFADAAAGTGCTVLDTRKTTPGLRRLEKQAAAAGGVTNHRAGLFDAILIKNNHISAAGGVRAAIDAARHAARPIEIEVRTRGEIEEALAAGATHLLIDNLTPEQAREEIRFIAGRAKVELSGGISLDTVRAYAETGADYVSSGAITHSAQAVDINFRLELL